MRKSISADARWNVTHKSDGQSQRVTIPFDCEVVPQEGISARVNPVNFIRSTDRFLTAKFAEFKKPNMLFRQSKWRLHFAENAPL